MAADYVQWTEEQFWAIPATLEEVPAGACRIVVLVGAALELHDSGYRAVALVFIGTKGEVLGRGHCLSDLVWTFLFPEAR